MVAQRSLTSRNAGDLREVPNSASRLSASAKPAMQLEMSPLRRFPASWCVEETDAWFVMKKRAGQSASGAVRIRQVANGPERHLRQRNDTVAIGG